MHATRISRIPFTVALLCGLLAVVHATTIDRHDPQQMIEQATAALLEVSTAARSYARQEPRRYYAEVAAVLDQVLDRDYFARGVMATYASARLYKTLETDQEREAFKARVRRFADVLEQVLIEKYADALLVFEGERIDVERVDDRSVSGKATLQQTIYDSDNTSYRVQYSLHQSGDGQWLIDNVVVEGVNLGATYRNQFAEAVERNKGDVDYVINHWGELMSRQAAEEKQKPADGNHG